TPPNSHLTSLPCSTWLDPSQQPSASVMWWWLLLPLLWALERAQTEEPGKLSQADDGGVPDGSFWAAYNGYTLEVPESVTVQEGLCVLVPCTFFHSGLQSSTDPVFGYWFLDGTNVGYGSPVATNNPHRDVDMGTRGRFQLVGDPQDNNCSLGIRDAKRKDTGRYFFRIQSRSVRHSYKDNQLSLWVTALTEVPVVDVPETLQSGRRSNVTCLVPWACEQGTPPVFSWSSSSPMVLEPGANPTPVLPITPSPEDHGANLTCQATFPGVGVTVERTVRLNVSYAPQNLSISVSWGAGTGQGCFSTAFFMAAGLSIGAKALLSLFLIVVVIMKRLRKSASGRDVQNPGLPAQHLPSLHQHRS
ncbi:myeloid cell surface antigen CD33-like, partial [Dipodomys spectabilis]|uniref:myeloid cell surface antigen CD33-like n=1 Tax=Dipodomys spectabilis TaxID=105255 RepID=UPI001C54738E